MRLSRFLTVGRWCGSPTADYYWILQMPVYNPCPMHDTGVQEKAMATASRCQWCPFRFYEFVPALREDAENRDAKNCVRKWNRLPECLKSTPKFDACVILFHRKWHRCLGFSDYWNRFLNQYKRWSSVIPLILALWTALSFGFGDIFSGSLKINKIQLRHLKIL